MSFQHLLMATKFFESVHAPEFIAMLKERVLSNTLKQGQCQIWSGLVDKNGYGYIRVTIHGKRLKLQCHRLVYFIGHSHPLSKSVHVSHLCHTKRCVELSHLSYEPQAVNNNRKSCKLDNECSGHHGYPRCLIGNNNDLVQMLIFTCYTVIDIVIVAVVEVVSGFILFYLIRQSIVVFC